MNKFLKSLNNMFIGLGLFCFRGLVGLIIVFCITSILFLICYYIGYYPILWLNLNVKTIEGRIFIGIITISVIFIILFIGTGFYELFFVKKI